MIQGLPARWDDAADVVVVGSGGAALCAATLAAHGGASVAIVEKADMVGGTTAVSGGVIWVPCNHHMRAAGLADTRDEALAYIRRLAMGREHDPALLEVAVDTAPEMLAWLEAHTPLRMQLVPRFPDYYIAYDVPGAKRDGRAVEPAPFPVGRELPQWADRLARRGTLMSLGSHTTLGEDLGSAARDEAQIERRAVQDIRPKGAGLIGALFKGLLERGVRTELGAAVRELVMADGAVVGVRFEQAGRSRLLGARRGVILACGGFEWNREMVRAFIGYDLYPVSPPHNTGDGQRMAMEAGAALYNMGSYWGTGAMLDPEITRGGEPLPQFDAARGMTGTLIVNQRGVRFVNENVPYNDFPRAFGAFDPARLEFPNQAPAWLIFDQKVKDTVQILSIAPGKPAPDWVPRGATLAELATQIDVDPETLTATVERFNAGASRGIDPDFQRHIGFQGQPLGPIGAGPYYAVAIYPGTLGTNGGPRIDRHGRVLSAGGGVIPGLYAAGNTAANVFGWAYPSGGGTLCNAFTFGYLAGRHAAAQPPRHIGA
jgi:succinate dehydrogenase/fumarate reductase flavoprotein subunit